MTWEFPASKVCGFSGKIPAWMWEALKKLKRRWFYLYLDKVVWGYLHPLEPLDCMKTRNWLTVRIYIRRYWIKRKSSKKWHQNNSLIRVNSEYDSVELKLSMKVSTLKSQMRYWRIKTQNYFYLILFQLCFWSGLNPADWDFSNIVPIPRKDKDACDPLQNRCITKMCCVAKI